MIAGYHDVTAELRAVAESRGYIVDEVRSPTGEFFDLGPITPFDHAWRAVIGIGMTPEQTIAHINESSALDADEERP